MDIAIIGSGYVGLVTGACLAKLGNKVICVDNDSGKVSALKRGQIPIYEPGLKELIKGNVKNKRLSFSTSIKDAVKASEVIFIAVGTPDSGNGEADLTGIEHVAADIAINLKSYRLIVEKSTVPVETGEWVKRTITTHIKGKAAFDVASNPEFLREGSAINDFMHPDRIVIGVESKRARDLLLKLYRPLHAPIVVTNIKSAELIKHASNAFLATKISFINAVSRICDIAEADVREVARGMGLDKRIGQGFLNAGIGYGGSCFPKDLEALVSIADKMGYDFKLLKEVKKINEGQKDAIVDKIKGSLWIIKGKTIGILGLAFKPDTDDIRNSPALDLIRLLQREGANIKAYDPKGMVKARGILKKVTFCRDPYLVCRGSDCLFIATEWNEFKELNLLKVKKLLKRPLIIDGRNIYEPEKMRKLGFRYISVGRKDIC
ncbi:MAG: UDP-glucose 6-dehydrogenase [Candidatus Omnitrophica bacterium CG08_land_8_20_14_0_20_41_16]|uniref:UDP-glucose 6-dehydrogenase n=1 Tax=Candidatus Sherwoodlollariibacterium unditelluris TaxID=1974757 RepID=A0A2G9YL48_9BACT|nr:MAG: UDP-glucose 6-dehydrogenase [Candidatus Omnitrophica bacterium CG23_combo_of_CG06-09_8_20_14_all_41_10]PIS33492.1 MAG: UDP-glucose 6-dehydrogenase [Candidatus Omnitrophica bacterium CG08_land_8_20_14_0_20_41_16]